MELKCVIIQLMAIIKINLNYQNKLIIGGGGEVNIVGLSSNF